MDLHFYSADPVYWPHLQDTHTHTHTHTHTLDSCSRTLWHALLITRWPAPPPELQLQLSYGWATATPELHLSYRQATAELHLHLSYSYTWATAKLHLSSSYTWPMATPEVQLSYSYTWATAAPPQVRTSYSSLSSDAAHGLCVLCVWHISSFRCILSHLSHFNTLEHFVVWFLWCVRVQLFQTCFVMLDCDKLWPDLTWFKLQPDFCT